MELSSSWCLFRRRRSHCGQPIVPAQISHASFLALQPGWSTVRVSLDVWWPCSDRPGRGSQGSVARHGRCCSEDSHRLECAAASVQPCQDDSEGMGRRRWVAPIPAGIHVLGRMCLCSHAASRHRSHAHVQSKSKLDRAGWQATRFALQKPNRLSVQDVEGRGREGMVQGHDRALCTRGASHCHHVDGERGVQQAVSQRPPRGVDHGAQARERDRQEAASCAAVDLGAG